MSRKETLGLLMCLMVPASLGAASLWSWQAMWGINHLVFLDNQFAAAAGVILGIALIVFFSPSLSHRFACPLRVVDSWLWGDRRTGPVVLSLLGGLAFIVLRAKTNLLGDGYTLLSFFGKEDLLLQKWTELGSTHVIRHIQSLFGGYSLETALSAFRIVSVVSGMIVLYNATRIIGRLVSDPVLRIMGLSSVVFSGGMLLFCGYVEVYPLVWAMSFIFLNLSVRCIQTGIGFWVVLLSFSLALLMHLQAAFLLPGAVLLVLVRMAEAKNRRRLNTMVVASVAALVSAIV